MHEPDDLRDLSTEDLDGIMRGLPPHEPDAPEAEAVADATGDPEAEAAETTEAAETEQPEEAPAAEGEHEEVDWRARAEEYAAKLEEIQAHAARVAGAKGYYESKYKDLAAERGVDADAYLDDPDPEGYGSNGELDALRLEMQELREERQQERLFAQDQRVLQESFWSRLEGIPPEIWKGVAREHVGALEDAMEQTDPQQRELATRAFVNRVVLEANEIAYQQRVEAAGVAKTAATARLTQMKRAATISGSGSVPPPPPKPKALEDMSSEEADRWLRENVRPL